MLLNDCFEATVIFEDFSARHYLSTLSSAKRAMVFELKALLLELSDSFMG